MKITFISDTHTQHSGLEKQLTGGDVLVFSGDLMGSGYNLQEVEDFCKWFSKVDSYDFKIFIAGNHDRLFENDFERVSQIINSYKNITYLQDDWCVIQIGNSGPIKFYGSPWQPEFYSWAFNLPRGVELAKKWALITEDTDVLITHGPAFGYGDRCIDGFQAGCRELLKKIQEIKPKIHAFGHIHEGYGVRYLDIDGHKTRMINASVLDERYRRVNPPIDIIL